MKSAPELAVPPSMTDHRSPNTDGHAVGNGKGRRRTPLEEQPAGAFDLLAAQIDALRQEIDYLKEQVARLQESALRERTVGRGEQEQTYRDSSS